MEEMFPVLLLVGGKRDITLREFGREKASLV